MEDGLHIRHFEVGDQEQARWLILEGLGEHFGYIDETLNPDLDDILHNYIMAGHVFLVAYIGWKLVGTGALIFGCEGRSEMVRITTHKGYRRRGIGQAIITSLLNTARAGGNKRIIVKTNASWHEAIRLYKRFGFVEYGCTTDVVKFELLLDILEQRG